MNYQILNDRSWKKKIKKPEEYFKKKLKKIEKTVKSLETISNVTGVDPTLTTRFKHQIISVDGDTSQKTINNFVDNEFLSGGNE